MRNNKSLRRLRDATAVTTLRSTSSPASWPWVSLTRLKWSMSMTSMASTGGVVSASAEATRATSSLSMWRRLKAPVSGSVMVCATRAICRSPMTFSTTLIIIITKASVTKARTASAGSSARAEATVTPAVSTRPKTVARRRCKMK